MGLETRKGIADASAKRQKARIKPVVTVRRAYPGTRWRVMLSFGVQSFWVAESQRTREQARWCAKLLRMALNKSEAGR